MSVALATRGLIRQCCFRDELVSLDRPQVQAVLEVRPRIRRATSPPTAALSPPATISVTELRPSQDVKSPADLAPVTKPFQTSVTELKPIIKKVEEE